jgi:hypothetical protein
MTAYVAKSCPVTCRQELHWQTADLRGREERGRERVSRGVRQWHLMCKGIVSVAVVAVDIAR